MNRVIVRVPATSANLGPGFDCLGLALDLHNHVSLDVMTRPVEPTVTVRGEGRDRLPRTGRNLALRAAQRVVHAATRGLFVAGLTLDNAIPVGGGLGSSAAAIAGAMMAANTLSGNMYGRDELMRMALEFEPHPDNLAAALHGGLTVSILTPEGRPIVMALPPPADLKAVVLTPGRSISTHHSRAALPETVPHADASYSVGRVALLVSSMLTGNYDFLSEAMADRLHQTYRAASYPAMPAIIRAALDAGARGAALSGSGPSILALCTESTREVAQAMKAAACAAGLDARVRELGIVATGATVVSQPHER